VVAPVTIDTSYVLPGNLVVTSNSAIKDRSVAGDSVGGLTVAAEATLTVNGILKLEGATALTVEGRGTLVATSGATLVIPATASLTIASGAGLALDPAVDVTGVDGSWSTIVADAVAASPVQYVTDQAQIDTVIHTDGVTTVIYSGATAIPAGSPETVPEDKTLRAIGAISDQSAALVVNGTLVLDNTTTISRAISGTGTLTLNREAGTIFGAAPTVASITSAGPISTETDSVIVGLLAKFDDVAYSGTNDIPSLASALTNGKTLTVTGAVAMDGGALALPASATTGITFSSSGLDSPITGYGAIVVQKAAGLDLGIATGTISANAVITTEGAGSVTTATTTPAIFNTLIAAPPATKARKVAFTGAITPGAAVTIPVGVEVSTSASAAITGGSFTYTVDGTLNLGTVLSTSGKVTVSSGGVLNVTGGTQDGMTGEVAVNGELNITGGTFTKFSKATGYAGATWEGYAVTGVIQEV
jgi:hypothetical protein